MNRRRIKDGWCCSFDQRASNEKRWMLLLWSQHSNLTLDLRDAVCGIAQPRPLVCQLCVQLRELAPKQSRLSKYTILLEQERLRQCTDLSHGSENGSNRVTDWIGLILRETALKLEVH